MKHSSLIIATTLALPCFAKPLLTDVRSYYALSANDDAIEYHYEHHEARNEKAIESYHWSKKENVSDQGAEAEQTLDVTATYKGPYSGQASIKCGQSYSKPSPTGHYGKLLCSSRWYYLFTSKTDGKVRLSMTADVEKQSAPEDAWKVYYGYGLANVRNGSISHNNGKFVDNRSSVTGTVVPGMNNIEFKVGRNNSGGIATQQAKTHYTLHWSVEAASYRLDAERNSDTLVNADTIKVDGNTLYQMQGQQRWTSQLLPVDTALAYQLSGRFKSTGSQASKIYFGLESYDENYNRIDSQHVNRAGTDGLVEQMTDSVVYFKNPVTGWASSDTPAYKRSIGVYLDGNINKKPDYLIHSDESSADPEKGGYKLVDDYSIHLNQALPEDMLAKVQPGVTVLKNHQKSSSHIYIASGEVPQEWTTYTRQLQGTIWQNSHDHFRPGTRYVKIYVAGNWGQGETMQFDDLVLKQVNEE
ncbi:hypothetical protein [Spartinivicinus poritis]|uniref:Uncharacterized protein n=1 Tax=Spartinivicinus poritis TaxID=2994640 RepID=A0ABT5UFE6_9GAMM|nr:hypothetical protein [Spartinivicinus sp. A2-2]MDE1465096.1 hypothetical protein [Spartinivicinus sp. A2-2]